MMAPKIGIIILAGGLSQRMGAENKLCKPLKGRPLICQTTAPFIKASMTKTPIEAIMTKPIIITGHQANEVKQALCDYDLHYIHNPDYASGMASAITTALAELAASLDHLMITLGDIPFIDADDIHKMIATHLANPSPTNTITRARFQGKSGHPVIWGSAYFDALSNLSGDEGARPLIKAHHDRLYHHEMSSHACLSDYDEPQDFDTL